MKKYLSDTNYPLSAFTRIFFLFSFPAMFIVATLIVDLSRMTEADGKIFLMKFSFFSILPLIGFIFSYIIMRRKQSIAPIKTFNIILIGFYTVFTFTIIIMLSDNGTFYDKSDEVLIHLSFTVILFLIIYSLFYIYISIIRKHQVWIINNGIFAKTPTTSTKVQEILDSSKYRDVVSRKLKILLINDGYQITTEESYLIEFKKGKDIITVDLEDFENSMTP